MSVFRFAQDGDVYTTIKLGNETFSPARNGTVKYITEHVKITFYEPDGSNTMSINIYNPENLYLNVVITASMDDSGGATTNYDSDNDYSITNIDIDIDTDSGDAISSYWLELNITCSGYEDYYGYWEM